MPWDVTKVAVDHGMLARLPLQLKSRSEPYEVVKRKDVELSTPTQMLVSILMA
ncbi:MULTISPECIES: hypothetical protein [unclassified Pseudomonas]|uniref:hypothetical protein n=1 Tax=Pseudomonas TaxID=286 RepID=UPI001EE32D13|nr:MULTISPECIES: hypothetical protein [unclassified Pseudomonas]